MTAGPGVSLRYCGPCRSWACRQAAGTRLGWQHDRDCPACHPCPRSHGPGADQRGWDSPLPAGACRVDRRSAPRPRAVDGCRRTTWARCRSHLNVPSEGPGQKSNGTRHRLPAGGGALLSRQTSGRAGALARLQTSGRAGAPLRLRTGAQGAARLLRSAGPELPGRGAPTTSSPPPSSYALRSRRLTPVGGDRPCHHSRLPWAARPWRHLTPAGAGRRRRNHRKNLSAPRSPPGARSSAPRMGRRRYSCNCARPRR